MSRLRVVDGQPDEHDVIAIFVTEERAKMVLKTWEHDARSVEILGGPRCYFGLKEFVADEFPAREWFASTADPDWHPPKNTSTVSEVA